MQLKCLLSGVKGSHMAPIPGKRELQTIEKGCVERFSYSSCMQLMNREMEDGQQLRNTFSDVRTEIDGTIKDLLENKKSFKVSASHLVDGLSKFCPDW